MKNKFILLFIIISLAASIFYGLKYSIVLNHISNLMETSQKIQYIIQTNSNINSYFGDKFANVNYDELNKNIQLFNENMGELLKSDIIFNGNFEKNLKDVNALFGQKIGLISEFNTLNSQSLILMKNLEQSFEKIGDKNRLSKIYSQISTINYKNSDEILNIKNRIKGFSPWDTNEADFISIANNIITNFVKLSEINDQKNLAIDSKIFGIHSEFTDFINQYYSELKYATFFFFLLFLTSMCALLLMEIFSIRQSALYRAFKEIADKSFCSISILDRNFKFKYINKQFQDSTKYSQNELNDKKMEILSSYEFREGFYIRMYDSVKKLGIFEHNELISKGKNGNLLFEKIKFFKLPTKDANYAYGVIKLDQSANKDIKEKLTDTEFELSNSAFLDHLTGFGNEAALMLRINQNELGKIIYININNFTNLRFFYKTNVINEILVQFAKTLKLAVETHRINAQIFRLQLDEFCLWYSGDDIKKDVKFIMQYFNNKIFRLNSQTNGLVMAPLDITIGISTDRDTPNTNRLYQATIAHHEAKTKNENIGFYNTDNIIEARYSHNQIMTNTIQHALTNNKIFVVCQPIFDISYKNIDNEFEPAYYEILVRLSDENGKTVMPREFLDVAKQTSFYIQITKCVIEETFRLLEKFPNTHFSINLSSLDISNALIRDIFIQNLKSSQYCSNLCIEILESEDIQSYETVANFVRKAKEFGCKIAIDDFASGYSNYYRILALNVDYIKIDGSIIKKIAIDSNSRAIVETIVSFAKRQNYEIVAEFVENIETMEIVKSLGIKFVQGFLLGKPMPVSSIPQSW